MTAVELFAVIGTFTAVYTVGYLLAERWHRRRSALAQLADRLTDGVIR